MNKKLKLLIILFVTIPSLSFAQFNFQNQPDFFYNDTVNRSGVDQFYIGDSTQNSQDSFGTNDSLNNDNTNIKNDTSLNANISNNNCRVYKRTFKSYVDYLGCVLRVYLLPFMFSLAIVAFVIGVVRMIAHPSNPEEIKRGRIFILFGLLGFFVITSIYALVAVIRRTVGFGYNSAKDTAPYNQLKDKIKNLK